MLQIDGEAMSISPLLAQRPLTLDAKLTASHNQEEIHFLTDQDATTNWHVQLDKGEKELWLEATFNEPVSIGSVVTGRGKEWMPRNNPELQVPDGEGGWKTVFKWKAKWEPVKYLDQPVKTDKIRLRVTAAKQYFLAEFELYPPM